MRSKQKAKVTQRLHKRHAFDRCLAGALIYHGRHAIEAGSVEQRSLATDDRPCNRTR